MRTGQLGKPGFLLAEPLDTWVPYASGSSARVFKGWLDMESGRRTWPRAVKIMRPDKAGYATCLFEEEVRILALLYDVPGVTRIVEAGFINLQNAGQIPKEPDEDEAPDHHLAMQNGSAAHVKGQVVRYPIASIDDAHEFIDELSERIPEQKRVDGEIPEWLPYLALERRAFPNGSDQNLFELFNRQYTRDHPAPVKLGVHICAQLCEIIQRVHERNIFYRDHKILHYGWNKHERKAFAYDWNIATFIPDGITAEQCRQDLIAFGLRVLYQVFTGDEHPESPPTRATKVQEVEASLGRTYEIHWEDRHEKRVRPKLRKILEEVLAGKFSDATSLKEVFEEYSSQ